ncbi:dienelactone hydrolase family protein [Litoricolaceae bacterium]|nr:dienelactone hydrolase family protein [Litorivicinaceae bacterium]
MDLKAHLSIPESPIGCLVVVHENRGLDDHIRDVANRFASEGFAVAAPDYLCPIGGSVADVDTNIANIKDVSREQVTEISRYWLDSLTILTKIKNQSILGFCWGGGVVNHCATQINELKKAVMFYGTAPDPSLIDNIRASLQLHYAENDERINAGRDDYIKALEKAAVSHEAFIYDGAGHAFFNDTREDRYHQSSAELAFKRALAFLRD